jgi:hypothetical protein
MVVVKYLPNYKYESLYLKNESVTINRRVKELELKTMINGTTSYPKDKIRIQFIDKGENRVVLENFFFYK